jgi:hypothetical protein
MGIIPNRMKKKQAKDTIVKKFIKLPLHQNTIDYLISLGAELKNYHYYDLIKLNSLEAIKSLSEEKQLKLIESIIKNRQKLSMNNKRILMETLATESPCYHPAFFLLDNILKKVEDLEQLYILPEKTLNNLDKKERRAIVSTLKLHSIKNLDFIIRINQSVL